MDSGVQTWCSYSLILVVLVNVGNAVKNDLVDLVGEHADKGRSENSSI